MIEHPGARILVIDDETEILAILDELLSRRGYRIDTADRGDHALELALQHHYDLILADLKMPGLGGFDLLRALRVHAPETEIIVMSGYGQQVSGELARLGVANYIVKPIDFDRLLSLMNTLILGSRARHS